MLIYVTKIGSAELTASLNDDDIVFVGKALKDTCVLWYTYQQIDNNVFDNAVVGRKFYLLLKN